MKNSGESAGGLAGLTAASGLDETASVILLQPHHGLCSFVGDDFAVIRELYQERQFRKP
jgi:hypothetical protein